ncbi:metallophosphoesterase family protein [Ihubacter sp. rT4E-8]|uniref:metallophosphoesterase family protein n=1 Tax=Ihubacter sp. rT4E-8 TaxID=3242369 RepID=UPI003CEE3090
MKILLISDTHGLQRQALQLYKYFTDIDLIIHCGDLQSDAEYIEQAMDETRRVPVVSVAGNSDRGGNQIHDQQVVDTPAGKIFVTHGNHQWVQFFKYDRLVEAAREQGCAAACFGHTHIPLSDQLDGLCLFNPGSLTEPREGDKGSFMILTATEEGFFGRIHYYDQKIYETKQTVTTGNPQKTQKVTGGFLRKLLNYSDRF